MEAKQTEIERLISDSKAYLKRNHYGEYTLIVVQHIKAIVIQHFNNCLLLYGMK